MELLRKAGRNLLLIVAVLLAADLLAVIVALPSALLGPAAGLPITVVILAAAGYAVRAALHRRDPAARERRVRAVASRRRERSTRKLELLRRHRPTQVSYREAAAETGWAGLLVGLGAAPALVIVSGGGERWEAPSAVVFMVAIALVGFLVGVLYPVHLENRMVAWRVRRLRTRLYDASDD